MKKLNKILNNFSRKMIALVLMLSVIGYNVMPSVIASISTKSIALNSIAENTYNVIFGDDNVKDDVASYTVGDKTVTASFTGLTSGTNEVAGDKEITISENFDAETMIVRVYSEGGFNATLNVNNGSTSLSDVENADTINLPSDLYFVIESKSSNNNVQGGRVEVSGEFSSFANNEFTYENGYKLSVSGASFALDKGHYEANVNNGTFITFTITLPNENDPVPDLMINGAREHFKNDNTFTREFNFSNESNHIMINLEFNNQGENQGGNDNNEISVQFDNAIVTGNAVRFNVDGINVDVTVTGEGYTFNGDELRISDITKTIFTLDNNYKSETMQVIIRGAEQYNSVLAVNENREASLNGLNFPGGGLNFSVEMKGQNPGPGQDNNQYENITLNVVFDPEEELDSWEGTIAINDRSICTTGLECDENARFDYQVLNNLLLENAGYTLNDKTNTIKIGTSFGSAPVKSVTINGVEYTKDSENVAVDKYGFFIITIAGAESYTISAKPDLEAKVVKTIIWVNPNYVPKNEEDANWVKDFTIEHGYANVIAVYDENRELVGGTSYNNGEGNCLNNEGFGLCTFYEGYRVVFEFVPEYGYQLTGISINEMPLAAVEAVNQFVIDIPEESGNLHFAAQFTKVDDVVKANSDKVTSGTIDLGNTLEGGSAQLTVSDANISQDKITGFENAAEGYTISNYLDIDLYNVYYKGKNDANDVWSKKIDTLENKATISIVLEEGVDAEDIVIVHNIHDGETYEIIKPLSYDPTTRTLTFETNSFSNYAIAYKETEKENQNVKISRVDITGNLELKDGLELNNNVFSNIKVNTAGVNIYAITLNDVEEELCYSNFGNYCSSNKLTNITGGKTYSISLNMNPLSGYEFDENVKVYVSGEEIDADLMQGELYVYISGIEVAKPVVVVPTEKDSNSSNAAKAAASVIESLISGNEVEELSEELANALTDAIDNDSDISAQLTTEALDEENITKEEKALIEKKLTREDKVLGYFDIDLNVYIDGTEAGQLTKLNDEIKVTVSVEDLIKDLPKVSNGYQRVYKVIRLHDGVADEIEAELNSDYTLTFTTDRFSTYTIVYTDILLPESPKTGDNILIYACICLISLLVIVSGVIAIKKHN